MEQEEVERISMDEQQKPMVSPITLFYSYAHEDELLRNELEKHLSLLRREGLISEWHDRQILAGEEWARDIDRHLETASMILLLISPDFLASDYCYDVEMQRALERHRRGAACVIPIILRPVDWHDAPFARLQCLPRNGKPITEWANHDTAFRDIVEGLRRTIEQRTSSTRPIPRFSPIDRQNRLHLLKRVRTIWIAGVLERSLHQASLIALDLQEQPDALANPWQLEVQETNLPPRPLPTGTSIVKVYDESGGELLILGEPGAGKTTLLLELTRTLLERAEQEERYRMPVVFNLPSWVQGRRSLAEWLVEELWTKYQVPPKLGQAWIDSNQVLPLLDGLDEVAENARPGCVQAINVYYQSHLEKVPVPLVVCCRSKEYKALPTRVNLQQAVSIRPLTDEQIERYLQSAKGQLEGLQQAWREDPEVYELVRRPLMLSVFTLAYQGAAPEDLPTERRHEVQQQQVFATYVERMLTRRGVSKRFSREQMLRGLTFLATRMQQHNQTVFYLEHMQPDWLGDRYRRLLYRLVVGLVVGLVYLLVVGMDAGLLVRLVFGLFVGLVYMLVFGLAFGLSQIQPREVLTRSWRGTRRSFVPGLGVGLFVGLVIGLLFGLWVFGLGAGLLFGLGAGLSAGLSAGLVSGFLTNQPDERIRLRSNQGIWRSAQNGLVVGLLFGLLFGLLVRLLFRLVFGLWVGLDYMVVFGLVIGLFVGLSAGLGAFFQHFALRFWLWRAKCIPWHVIVYLDESVERILLRKVGGGYIFIHRQLLDYFASLETPTSEEVSTVLVSPQKPDEKE